jgi:hypothetical protein
VILGDRIKRGKMVVLASTWDRPGRVGVTLALVTIRVRLWVRSQTTGPVEGFTPCKGGGLAKPLGWKKKVGQVG